MGPSETSRHFHIRDLNTALSDSERLYIKSATRFSGADCIVLDSPKGKDEFYRSIVKGIHMDNPVRFRGLSQKCQSLVPGLVERILLDNEEFFVVKLKPKLLLFLP